MNELIRTLRENRIRAYEASPGDIREHVGIEEVVIAGGYGYRQILELVQNGADAILEANEAGLTTPESPRIEIQLSENHLIAANTGAPFGTEGIEALLRSHSSTKRGNQIGRFGLGFKSLLRLEGKIDIVSGPYSFGFDPERCRKELMSRFGCAEAPGLRLAWDLPAERSEHLRKCFPWATTVISAEITSRQFLTSLQDELKNFPAEFLIFLPVPVKLTLETHSGPAKSGRTLTREATSGNELVIHDGLDSHRWRVVEKLVHITDPRAITDATHIHQRNQVPVSWAIPLSGGKEDAGRFWAFFPTQTPSYLPGILNAPWKLNSDRNAIISGEWNTALMEEAASLISSSLHHIRTDEDPAKHLDAFPRRMERSDEVAFPLVEALWKHIAKASIIPDMDGRLHNPNDLWIHPTRDWKIIKEYYTLAGEEYRKKLVHADCYARKRDSRLLALAEKMAPPKKSLTPISTPSLRIMPADQWFAGIASVEDDKSILVLQLADSYQKEFRPAMWESIRPKLRIIPTSDGRLTTADETVFAPSGMIIPNGRFPVADTLAQLPECRRILQDIFRIKCLDERVWNEVLQEKLPREPIHDNPLNPNPIWGDFWKLLRSAPENVQENFIKMNIPRMRIRNRGGFWGRRDELLLPGEVVSDTEEPASNRSVLVDESEHGKDRRLLEIAGVQKFPTGLTGKDKYENIIKGKTHLDEWRKYITEQYLDQLDHHQNPQVQYLEPLAFSMPAGWMLLADLKGISNARVSRMFVELLYDRQIESTVLFGHRTRQDNYPKKEVAHPLLWYLLRYGTWIIGKTSVRLSVIAARTELAIVTRVMSEGKLRRVIEMLQTAEPPVPILESEIYDFWMAMIRELATPDNIRNDRLSDLWAGTSGDGIVPDALETNQGTMTLTELYVTGSHDLANQARNHGHAVITLDETSLTLWLSRGARNLDELIQPRWRESIGPVELLTSVVPELRDFLREDIRATCLCRPVSDLEIRVEERGTRIACLLWENMLILDMAQLSSFSRADKFRSLLNELSTAGWLNTSPENARKIIGDARLEDIRAYVAQGQTLPERLLRAVGGRKEPLLRLLGPIGEAGFVQECRPVELAELVLAQLGPVTLQNLKDELEAEGLAPPSRWRHPEARDFVLAIGFPEEFGDSPESRRDPEEVISGPIHLPELHEYQEEVLDGIRAIISNGARRRRAVVSLPTGGGKTRVTVEAAVRLVLKPGSSSRLVLWIAQTDELCEQAVQAFRQVWVNTGATDTDLRIIRLWGGNPNPPHQDPGKPVVVISSIQTLNSRMGNRQLAWLQKPGLCIVDECHHAITPSYTNLLRFLDAEASRSPSAPGQEPAFLGLSATPFRTDDEESKRLARRFDNLWLPADQEALHERLHSQGVLADVVSEELETGSSLTPEEQRILEAFPQPWEGFEFEQILESINQRLGGNSERNERLVERIRQADERSVLVFANSVHHAEELAARLNLLGIPSAAVSGATPRSARRYFLERFKGGSMKVLCNHSVLSTGFDAPMTDMVLISRAVFSPVRYMQMVGRGLRGVKNGGKSSCRIVTVMDNLGRFQKQHAYHYCQKYFFNSSLQRTDSSTGRSIRGDNTRGQTDASLQETCGTNQEMDAYPERIHHIASPDMPGIPGPSVENQSEEKSRFHFLTSLFRRRKS